MVIGSVAINGFRNVLVNISVVASCLTDMLWSTYCPELINYTRSGTIYSVLGVRQILIKHSENRFRTGRFSRIAFMGIHMDSRENSRTFNLYYYYYYYYYYKCQVNECLLCNYYYHTEPPF